MLIHRHTNKRTRSHTYTHTDTLTHIKAHTHTLTLTLTHTHAHTHIHTHRQPETNIPGIILHMLHDFITILVPALIRAITTKINHRPIVTWFSQKCLSCHRTVHTPTACHQKRLFRWKSEYFSAGSLKPLHRYIRQEHDSLQMISSPGIGYPAFVWRTVSKILLTNILLVNHLYLISYCS